MTMWREHARASAAVCIGVALWVTGPALGRQGDARPAPGTPPIGSGPRCLTPPPAPGPDGLYTANTWTGGVVYYVFNANVTPQQQQAMFSAWSALSAAAGLQFVPRTNEPNYLQVVGDLTPTCGASFSSAIGMTGAAQTLTICINHWGLPGLLMHETMHALGLWHEQQRSDRDPYIEVNLAAVSPGFGGNYSVVAGATPHGLYDFASLMHYDQFGFSAKGDRTIKVKPPYQRAWQYNIGLYALPGATLSSGDQWVLKQMYGGGNPAPRAFALTAPANGAPVGQTWLPLFSWQASEGATAYRLQADDNPLFASPEIDAQVTAVSYAHPSPLAPDRLYWWRVSASNAQGTTEAFPIASRVFYTRSSYAPTLFVDDSAPPSGNGLSWATALRDLSPALEAAIASAGAVSEIRVAQGTYKPAFGSTDAAMAFWLPDACAVLGGFAGFGAVNPDARDIDAFPTVLSGDLLGNDGSVFAGYADNSNNVVFSMSNPASTMLEGFTIRAGNAVSGPLNAGGGLVVDGGNPTIRRCMFILGQGTYGGALFVGLSAPTPRFEQCRFSGNRTLPGGLGGAVLAQASGVFRMDGCRFDINTAGGGGAIGLYFGKATVVNSVFVVNSATSTVAFPGGGAVASYNTSTPSLINCTLTGNTSAVPGGGVFDDAGSTTTIGNSVLWSNTPDQHAGGPVIQFSNVQGGGTGSGNISAAPVFVGSGGGAHPFALASGSPGIDAGFSFLVPAGVTTDHAGGARFVDDPCTPDTGAGPPVVDMGAYEHRFYPDCNASGSLTVADFGCFQTKYVLGDPYADCNADAGLSIADFGCFQNKYVVGCP
ncbi:MAG: M12 family metallopeptidase [Phycisphaerales bacterium]